MDEIVGMTIPPPLPNKNHQTRDSKQTAAAAALGQQTMSIQTVSFPSPLSTVEATRATVLIGGSAPEVDSTATCSKDRVPEVQSDWQKSIQCPQQHVVKIRINPKDENGKVISSVRLNLDETLIDSEIRNNYDECADKQNGVVLVCAASRATTENNGCVRISIINGKNNINNEMIQPNSQEGLDNASINSNANYFYCGTLQSPLTNMVMSSGQCSPSDTLDSGTCSDLDGTPPPPLPKKNSSTIIFAESTNNNHRRTGSLTSSGADADSDEHDNDDDNQSNISCDSLNSQQLSTTLVNGNANSKEKGRETAQQPATNFENNSNDVKVGQVGQVNRRTKARRMSTKLDILLVNDVHDSNLKTDEYDEKGIDNYLTLNCNSRPLSATKVSCIPIVSRSSPIENKQQQQQSWSPIVRECTYEERNQKQEIIQRENNDGNYYSNYNNSISSTKYLYDDDRFYKFHLHEPCCDDKNTLESMVIGENDDKENECFAGYKISEKEAIRSAKGTVRGVKNRVRAGIATFLQKPSTKNYKIKDEGKVVVYSTTMGIVRETYYACMKVKQILRTHLVKYEDRDMFMSTECQTELRDRIGSTTIEVPQLFIDGEYIGDADTVERLNESGELRIMLKPYKSADACSTCKICGGYRLLPCPVCNGSKKSVHRNDFTTEFVALKCMNCDEAGLVRCQHC